MISSDLTKRGVNIKRLPDRWVRFLGEWIQHYDGKKAALSVGYSPKTAKRMAHQILHDPRVQGFVAKWQRELVESAEIKVEEILQQLYYLVSRRMSDFVYDEDHERAGEIREIHDMGNRAQSVVDGLDEEITINELTGDKRIKRKLRLSSKVSAVDMALKHKGLYAAVKQEVAVMQPDWKALQGPPPDDIEQKLLEAKELEVKKG